MNRIVLLVASFLLLVMSVVAVVLVRNRDRNAKIHDGDEEWQTKLSLSLYVQRALGRFNQLADETDRRKIRQVRSLDELWSVIRSKVDRDGPLVPSPRDSDYVNYITDGWKYPFRLSVVVLNDVTIVRIASDGSPKKLYVEAKVDSKGGSTRASWDPDDAEAPP